MRLVLVKRLLLGAPMPLAQARHERLNKTVALAVFASDPLSSVAYATEEILLVLMLVGAFFNWLPEAPYQPHPPGLEGLGLFLLLRSYAAGCTALTGVEAVSNGVQALKPPEGRNAQAVMTALGVISIVMFLGITYLAYDFGIIPGGDETVVSMIARRVWGNGVPYYLVQAATLLILVLAANTSYAEFPRLSSILARARFVPRQFANQGDRLVFSNGIMILSGFAILLIVAFQGDTHALLPLYAIGVFISFTLSQGGMVRRWLRLRERGR